MGSPVTIVASQSDWEELRDHSSLPVRLFGTVTASGQNDDPGQDCCFRHMAPEDFPKDIQSLHSAPTDKREEFDEFVHSLLGATAVHLVVVRPESDKNTLAEVKKFHSWLRATLQGSDVAHRAQEFRLVLVLVFCVDFDPTHEQELTTIQQQGMVRRVYLMGNRLEAINQSVLHARHVWPVAVGRLLLVLGTWAKGSKFPVGGGAYAWRTFVLDPYESVQAAEDSENPEALQAKWVKNGFNALFGENPSNGDNCLSWDLNPYGPKLSDKPPIPKDSPDWINYDPGSAWRTLSKTWRDAITEHGNDSEYLYRLDTASASGSFWASMGERPSAVKNLERVVPDQPTAPADTPPQLPVDTGGLDSSRREADRLNAVFQSLVRHRAPGMAGWTLVIGVVVLFVGVFATSGLRLLAANTLLPSLVAVVSAFAGSVCACLLVIYLEDRAGAKVMERSREQIRSWWGAWEKLAKVLSDRREAAAKYQAFIRRLGCYWQLIHLGKRLRQVLDWAVKVARTVRTNDGAEVSGENRQSGQESDSHARTVWQRHAYRAGTVLHVSRQGPRGDKNTPVRPPGLITEDQGRKLIEEWKEHWRKKWNSTSGKLDSHRMGAIPVAEVFKYVSDAAEDLEARIDKALSAAIRQQLPHTEAQWQVTSTAQVRVFLSGLSCVGVQGFKEGDIIRDVVWAPWTGNDTLNYHGSRFRRDNDSTMAVPDNCDVPLGLYHEEVRVKLQSEQSSAQSISIVLDNG
ncbi:MAG: hypothetical protein N2111_13785 [Candidatus Sumerlaeaceae bacterium]|nr:hypothetical protein [Candidatus Sumerlaeaceae bacterium]